MLDCFLQKNDLYQSGIVADIAHCLVPNNNAVGAIRLNVGSYTIAPETALRLLPVSFTGKRSATFAK